MLVTRRHSKAAALSCSKLDFHDWSLLSFCVHMHWGFPFRFSLMLSRCVALLLFRRHWQCLCVSLSGRGMWKTQSRKMRSCARRSLELDLLVKGGPPTGQCTLSCAPLTGFSHATAPTKSEEFLSAKGFSWFSK